MVPEGANRSTTNFVGKTFGDLQDKMNYQLKILKENYNVGAVSVMWECEFKKLLNQSLEDIPIEMREEASNLRNYVDNVYNHPPVDRLQPRDALKGGKTEVFRLAWRSEDHPGYKMLYLDHSSLYPSVGMREPYCSQYPTGKYQVLIGDDLKDLRIHKGSYKLRKENRYGRPVFEPVRGLMLVRVKPPENMWLPFLPYKYGERTYYALCEKCIKSGQQTICKHSDFERSWIQTYCSNEVNYALSLGYRFEIFEIFHYPGSDPLFAKFLALLGSFKIKASGFPSHVISPEARQSYCDEINLKNGYDDERLKLTPDNVSRDESKRQFYKDCLNKLLGKLGQDTKSKTKFLSTYDQVENLYYDPHMNLKEIFAVTQDLVQVGYEKKTDFEQNNNNSNVVIASFTTSSARIAMDTAFRKLLAAKIQIVYTDTDSVICVIKKEDEADLPLVIGENFGEYKHELGPEADIVAYAASGPKAYMYIYKNKHGEFEKECKVKGMSLRGKIAKETLSTDSLESGVESFARGESKKIYVPQFGIDINKKTKQLSSNIRERVFQNDVFTKRIALRHPDDIYATVPIGFRKYEGY